MIKNIKRLDKAYIYKFLHIFKFHSKIFWRQILIRKTNENNKIPSRIGIHT